MIGLFSCSRSELRTYSYCKVDDVTRDRTGYWLAHCGNGGSVIFPQPVNVGDDIYYSPYWEDNDAVTVHGYIRNDQVVP